MAAPFWLIGWGMFSFLGMPLVLGFIALIAIAISPRAVIEDKQASAQQQYEADIKRLEELHLSENCNNEVLIDEGGVCIRSTINPERIYGVPWGIFESVTAYLPDPNHQQKINYSVSAEFSCIDIDWDMVGSEAFLQGMERHLPNFNIDLAALTIKQLGPLQNHLVIFSTGDDE